MILFGDPLTYERYKWLLNYMPRTSNSEKVLDLGCGNGGFSFELAKRGYEVVGISWDASEVTKAQLRTSSRVEKRVTFVEHDVRTLDTYKETGFDFVLCLENIEHILDDKKLMVEISNKLSQRGILLLTTPYYFFNPISKSDTGPFSQEENGDHVRRGYTSSDLKKLCDEAGLSIEKIEFYGRFFSQLLCRIQRTLSKYLGAKVSWLVILAFRPIQLILDSIISKTIGNKPFGICLIAQKV